MAQQYFKTDKNTPTLLEVSEFLSLFSSSELLQFKLFLLDEHRRNPFEIAEWTALNYAI